MNPMTSNSKKQLFGQTIFLDKTKAYASIIVKKSQYGETFGVSKYGKILTVRPEIKVYVNEYDSQQLILTYFSVFNPLMHTKLKLIELNKYQRNKEGSSPHCGACHLSFSESCKDCPKYQARMKADNFIHSNALKYAKNSDLWLMQINYLYSKIQLLEAYILETFGLKALKLIKTKLNIELNTNLYVRDALQAVNARQPAFDYLFARPNLNQNPDNPYPMLIGADITNKTHKAKYYVKVIGPRNSDSILRMELLLSKITLVRGNLTHLHDLLIRLFQKHLSKYEWVEQAAISSLLTIDESIIKACKKLHSKGWGAEKIQQAIQILKQLLRKPIKFSRDKLNSAKIISNLIKLKLAVSPMRGYVAIAPEYFVNNWVGENNG